MSESRRCRAALAALGLSWALAACRPADDTRALFAEGQALRERKEYAAAIAPLARAFAADPSHAAAGLSLAELLVQEERHAEAVEVCRRLETTIQGAEAAAVRDRAKSAYLAARALRELGQWSAAEREATRSLELLPGNAAVQALRGGLLARLGRHEEAVSVLAGALRIMETLRVQHGAEQLHYQLGQSLLVLGRGAEAEAHFARHRELKALSDRNNAGERARDDAALAGELARAGGGASVSASRPTEPVVSTVTPGGDAFVDVAREMGIDFRHDTGAGGNLHPFETVGGGAAWLDYDLDGDPDLYLVSGQAVLPDGTLPANGKNRLYRNDLTRFADVTGPAGVPGRGYGLGAMVGDVDSDGAPDLYVLCFGPNVLYRNRSGAFEEVLRSGAEGSEPFSGGAAFGDFDADGLLDLFLASYFRHDPRSGPRCFERSLRTGQPIGVYCGPISYDGVACSVFRGQGNGTFRDVTRASGVAAGADAASKGLGVLSADLDDDGDVDVFVACDTTAKLLYRNRGDGSFDEVGLEAGVAASDTGLYEGSMGVALGDVNGDGRGDLLVTNFAEESNRVYLGAEQGAFTDGTASTGLGLGSRPLVGWGVGFLDVGCDGALDAFVANGHIYHNAEEWLPGRTYRQRCLLYRQEGRRFTEQGETAGAALRRPGAYRGAAFADYDLDGDEDVLVVELDAPPLLLRATGAHGHWLAIDLEGVGPGARDAVGARVDIVTRSGRQTRWRHGGGSYLSASESRLHFGLGHDEDVETLTVTWPGRRTSVLRQVKVDQRLRVRP